MSKLNRGDSFIKAGLKWTVIEITKCGYKCIAEQLKNEMVFGKNNNWKESSLREYLNGAFLKMLAKAVGEGNIIPFERDLISLDGLKDYGICTDHVSIISFDEYRANRDLFPGIKSWLWTLTPDSTESNDDATWIAVVSPSGYVRSFSYFSILGVRPVCIFDSSIFESEEM